MPLWPRRKTQARDETRALITEAVQQALSEAGPPGGATTTAPTRLTYPASDAQTQSILKNYDVANRARKITLYQTFLGESWVSACVEAIAARLISGGWLLKPLDPKRPNLQSKTPLQEYLDWCNQDEDFSQIVHSLATDLLWAGECFAEITWKQSPVLHRPVPYELFTVDVISMDYVIAPDRKSIASYQQTTDTGEKVDLEPSSILRVWFPDPRNRLRALSPIEKLLNPLTWDTYLQLSEQKYFEQGNRGDLHINVTSGDQNQAARYLKWIKERFLGVKNAHVPLVTYGQMEVAAVGNRAQIDVLSRRKFAMAEVLAVYKVPPHMVSVIEAGSIGGAGTSDTMEKQFIHTAVDPVRWRLFNPINFRIARQGFGIDDWTIDTSYADLRDTKDITTIQTQRIAFGLSTPDEERAEMKREPYPEGGDQAIIITRQGITPVRDLAHIMSQERLQTAQTLQGEDTPEDAVAKGKLTPPGPPPGQQPPQGEDGTGDGGDSEAGAGADGTGRTQNGTGRPASAPKASKPKPAKEDALPADDLPLTEAATEAEAQRRELALWRRTAIKRVRENRPPRVWQSDVLQPATVALLNDALRDARTPDDVRGTFAPLLNEDDD